jgi:hypothetical protein
MIATLRLGLTAALMSVSASTPFALTFELPDADIRQALAIGREDGERAKFEAPYVYELRHPIVRRVEVVTEFRRMVLITAEKKAAGDWLFVHGMRAAKEALKPWRGLVTVAAQLQFSTFVSVPPLKLALGEAAGHAAATPRDIRVIPQWAPSIAGDGSVVLTGTTFEADFNAASVGQTTRSVTLFMAGQELTRLPIDFAALR